MSYVASHRWLSWSYVDTGTFLIAFHFLGLLYAWGVIQANLNKKGLGGSQLLSLIGGLNAFFTAAFCLPVRGRGPRISHSISPDTLTSCSCTF